ncbi:hypothetical protein CEP51_003513 [Fusarium floridanum]|uniref:F-box domain-containing protein n=1 Tax=Fusarium floridanum TaxID=1325733 RepID=A0A428S5M5_9HYPO|nr:hypothetical protein CEP51_003513 [Fusarium floridanum]
MSRCDTYCALCGVLIGYRGFAFETDEYDQTRLAENGTGWISDVWLIRRHPTSLKVSLFGPASLMRRLFNVFVFPPQDQLRSKVQAYTWSTECILILPLHTSCYDILCKVASPEVIDLEILFDVLKTHFPVNSGVSLDLDYGAASVFQQDKWAPCHGFEYLVTSPTEIPHVDSLTRSILQDSRLGEQHSFPSYEWVNLAQDGVIRAVPPEVLERIASYLDAKDLCSFRLVSKQFVAASSANSFWRSRVSLDTPWMAEFLDRSDIQHDDVDWRKLYQTLREIVVEKPSSPYIPGIRNRCRIWELCTNLMKEYHSLEKKQNTELTNPPILSGACCCPITRLRYPVDKPTITKSAGLIRSYGDLSSTQPIVSTYWTASGELAGIGTSWYRDGASTTLGSKDLFDTCQELEIPKDDWISRLIFTIQDAPACTTGDGLHRRIVGLKVIFSKRSPVQFGQSQGYKRVLCASENHFTVGIRATWSPGKPLAKLAILQQNVVNVPPEIQTRLKLEIRCPLSSGIRRFLWKNEVPPDQFHLGYRNRVGDWDEWLMEPLIFGTTDEELSEITSIAADVQLGGFEIVYKNGTRRGIGPRRHAMKHLSIDGPGGERIRFAWVESAGAGFLTNRGRQLVIGRLEPTPKPFPWLKLHRSRPCCTGHGLTGIFCHWSKTQDLDFLDAFSASLPGVQEARPSIDSHESYWDPAPPMRLFREASMAYGCRVKYNEETGVVEANSSEAPIVSWLDCERLLESIQATFCHRTKTSQIPLVALSFRYADSHVTTVGPSEFYAPSSTEQDVGLHYTHNAWDVQGSQLKSLRLWTDASQTLTGLQFLAQNGAESPRWGDCKTEGPVELNLQTSSEGWAKGLKVFIDSDGKNVCEDYVVVGIQLLEIESSSGSATYAGDSSKPS